STQRFTDTATSVSVGFNLINVFIVLYHPYCSLFISFVTFELLPFKVTPVIGYEGGEVDIRCPYEDKYDKYTKYLCRGECLIGQSIKIEHGQTSAAEGRFSLYDNTTAGSFTVTITGLTAQDSGKYWCGIDSVKKVVSVSGCEGHSVSITCNYERSCRDQHEKYFCRGDKTSSCIATGLKVSTSVKERGRFSLEDDPAAKVFNVGIGELSAEDTGIYWCVEWCGELLFTTPPLPHTSTAGFSEVNTHKQEMTFCHKLQKWNYKRFYK
uniref:Immunoglobulin V-set domain-containing protein n=1 Tax=Denticeps clupeoides TaxID=299321 RepID=A0AAY3ZZC0_9TELE